MIYQRADILKDKGNVSQKSANSKVNSEYEKFQKMNHEIIQVDEDYFEALNQKHRELSSKKRRKILLKSQIKLK